MRISCKENAPFHPKGNPILKKFSKQYGKHFENDKEMEKQDPQADNKLSKALVSRFWTYFKFLL